MGIKSQPLAPVAGNQQPSDSSSTDGASSTSAAAASAPSNVTFFSALNGDEPSLLSKKQAKVLFDYEATDPSEISVSANQVNLNS